MKKLLYIVHEYHIYDVNNKLQLADTIILRTFNKERAEEAYSQGEGARTMTEYVVDEKRLK